MATLYVLDRGNGWCGGYIVKNGTTKQVFHSDALNLQQAVKQYEDMGYTIEYLDKEQTRKFLENKIEYENYLFRHGVVFD